MTADSRPTRTVRKAVIPAAGYGTRFLPATKAQPKEMIPVVDRPAIQYVVEEAVAAGITDILIVTSMNKQAMENHFDRAPDLERTLEAKGKTDMVEEIVGIADLARVHFVRQPEARGLGHAIGMGAAHVGDEPFAVLLPDDLMIDDGALLRRMIEVADDHPGAAVISVKEFEGAEISAYGCADPTETDGDVMKLRGIVEKPPADEAPSQFGSTGRYVFPPVIFDEIARTNPGHGGEIQITDAMTNLAAGAGLYAVSFVEGRYDVGQKLDYLRATVELGLDHPELGGPFADVLASIVAERGIGS